MTFSNFLPSLRACACVCLHMYLCVCVCLYICLCVHAHAYKHEHAYRASMSEMEFLFSQSLYCQSFYMAARELLLIHLHIFLSNLAIECRSFPAWAVPASTTHLPFSSVTLLPFLPWTSSLLESSAVWAVVVFYLPLLDQMVQGQRSHVGWLQPLATFVSIGVSACCL